MKITIYDLLGMIKDGKAPKIIIYKNKRYWYSCKEKDYYLDADYDEALFDSYVITDILNDEVEILEITITYNPAGNKIEKIDKEAGHSVVEIIDKINEIIEAINER